MNPSIPLLAPAELPGHVSRGQGPSAPLPEGAAAPPESAAGGFGALVAGLLAPGLAKLPGAGALPEDVPRPPGEEHPGLDRSAEALANELPVALPWPALVTATMPGRGLSPPGTPAAASAAAPAARVTPPPGAALGAGPRAARAGEAPSTPAPQSRVEAGDVPVAGRDAAPPPGPPPLAAAPEAAVETAAHPAPAQPPVAAAATPAALETAAVRTPQAAVPQQTPAASGVPAETVAATALPQETAPPGAAPPAASPRVQAEPATPATAEARPATPAAPALEARAGGTGGAGAGRPDGESRPAPRMAVAALERAPQSEHAAAVAFVATAGPPGPGGVAAVAAPPAVESSAEPEALAGRLADGIELATTRGPREFRIVVRPPELGRLDVRVVETSEGLRVAIEASSRELRELLQQQLPQLRVALEGRELRIERLDVQQADPGTEWTDPRDEPRGRGRAGEQAQNQQTASFGGADDAADEGSETPPSSDGGQHVDVRA